MHLSYISSVCSLQRGDNFALAKTVKMEKVVIDKKSVFVEHVYGQHAGAGWERDHAVWYYTYVLPEAADFKDVVAFAYGDSVRRKPKNKAVTDQIT